MSTKFLYGNAIDGRWEKLVSSCGIVYYDPMSQNSSESSLD